MPGLFIPIKSPGHKAPHGAIRETLLQQNHPRQGTSKATQSFACKRSLLEPLSAFAIVVVISPSLLPYRQN